MPEIPKVSVVMSVYNGEKYLASAIDSILSQTFTNFEFIIINDGSIDRTFEILNEYEKSDSRLRIFHQENMGLTKSLNKAVSLANGIYIARQDPDDKSLPERLEKQVKFLDQNPDMVLVGTVFQVIDENDDVVGVTKVPLLDEQIRTRLISSNCFGHGTVMIRKSCLEKTGAYDESFKYAQDYELWLRLSEKFKVSNLNETLYIWRKRNDAASERNKYEQEEYARIAVQNALIRRNKNITKTESPVVSVIVPTFNRPAMLKEAVASILGQTYQDFEIIVVNDAGEDVEKLIEEFEDERIIYLKHEGNKGLAASRNTGIAASKGKYISYLDDDDIFYPNHLEMLINCLEKGNYKVAFPKTYRAIQTVLPDKKRRTVLKDLPYKESFDKEFFLVENYIPIIAIAHDRSCLEQTGVFDESLPVFEDWDFLIRLSRIYDFLHIPEFTCEVRVRLDNSNMTFSMWDKFLKTKNKIYSKYEQYTQNRPHILELQKKSFFGLKELVDRSESFVEILLAKKEAEMREKLKEKDVQISQLQYFFDKVKNSLAYKIYKKFQILKPND